MNDNDGFKQDVDGSRKPETTVSKAFQRKEAAKKFRKEAYQKAKERQQKYLNSPEVKEKIAKRKMEMKLRRKENSHRAADERKIEKRNFLEAKTQEKMKLTAQKDEELQKLIKPALTLIQGGQDN
jgi:hypothetical protein